jgi:hypothetical protein
MQKFIICLLIICVALPTMAIAECEVKFQWTPQGKTDDVAGYMIFAREKGNHYDYNVPIWEGDNTFLQCTIDGLDESKTYYFVIRAVDQYDNQSYDSPEVEFSYNSDPGSDAGIGGDGVISTSTSFSSCFLQSLFGSNAK